MEPNKLETEFRDKLEHRRIQPSDMAWDRLDAMLSVAENKKPKRDRKWLYMAATFLAFLLVGVIFLNQENENNNGFVKGNSVVNQGGKPQTTVPGNEVPVITQETPQPVQQMATVDQPVAKHKRKNNTTLVKAKDTQMQQAYEAVISQPAQQQAIAYQSVSQQDAEALLAAATSQHMPKKKNTVKVDANSLLSSVEGELDDNYRSSVFQKAVKNFNVVKTAVANRNYQ